MQPTVARLYRYPVKGMTPEPVDRLRILERGAVEGDRVLGFMRGRDAQDAVRQFNGVDWWPKAKFLQLMDTPGFARLRASYDSDTYRLAISLGGETIAEGDVREDGDRARLVGAVEAYAAGLPEFERQEDFALQLAGDGATPAFHDRGARHITLVASSSIAALAETIGEDVDERRFRMNAILDDLPAWQELEWIGRRVRIGSVEAEVSGPVIRCLATHANPETGERDREVLTTLTRQLGMEEPAVGVLAVASGAGEMCVGDAVELL
ncbi:MAG: MOSC domain-containing protein [Dehalococcoidia bacterium]|nr:MOSC domain-containing protein [Dehalococcoidia bacterium]